MYKTLEELQKNYPVGYTYRTYWNHIDAYCPTANDVIIFKQKHPIIRNYRRFEDGTIWCEERKEDKVEGYLFDGEYWYPAIQTWDGWLPIDEEELENDL